MALPPFFSAWIVMLLCGAIGHESNASHNSHWFVGYWLTFFVIWLIKWIF